MRRKSLGAEAIVLGSAGDGLIGRHSIGSVTGELLYSSALDQAKAELAAWERVGRSAVFEN